MWTPVFWVKAMCVTPYSTLTSSHLGTHFVNHVGLCNCSDRLISTWMCLHSRSHPDAKGYLLRHGWYVPKRRYLASKQVDEERHYHVHVNVYVECVVFQVLSWSKMAADRMATPQSSSRQSSSLSSSPMRQVAAPSHHNTGRLKDLMITTTVCSTNVTNLNGPFTQIIRATCFPPLAPGVVSPMCLLCVFFCCFNLLRKSQKRGFYTWLRWKIALF